MKKIAVLLLLVSILFFSCISPLSIEVKNTSDFPATLGMQRYPGGSTAGLDYHDIEIQAGKTIFVSLFKDDSLVLKSTNRNILKKHTDMSYEILNMEPVMFTIYNTTDKKVKLSEVYNLFDIQTLNPNETKNNVQVFNPEKIQPLAVSDPDNIILRACVQEKKIIIAY